MKCKVCGNRVRNSSGKFCSKHIDWTKTAHGASLLTNNDVVFLSKNVDKLSDYEIVDFLLRRKAHINHTRNSVLLAVRHHRRKYLQKGMSLAVIVRYVMRIKKNIHVARFVGGTSHQSICIIFCKKKISKIKPSIMMSKI